ncbi:hypothetical protein ABT294_20355 [Nonomuraea sp. NPDC000554]|uniref:hypothetical protein n=1 Tax=Nonomuraea sp. NPDC000554 TaxID=3154259 RepID=UPI00331ABD7D
MTTPDAYAQAVRDALAEHPEREELLEDLDDHLAEIAAESDVPLEERLGPPEAYAEELVAAYGGRPSSRQRGRVRVRERVRALHVLMLGSAPYSRLVAFLPELRPGWWVLRGYLLTMLVFSAVYNGRLVPENVLEWVAVGVGIWVSVWFGSRARGRMLMPFVVAVNAVAALTLIGGFMGIAEDSERLDAYNSSDSSQVTMATVSAPGDEVYNIKPYAKDGTPLTDVYLYDQDGKPVTTNPEFYGYKVDRSCGEPILNRYPLPLVADEGADESTTALAPPSCPTAKATDAPPVKPMESPSPVPTPLKSR